MWVTTAIAMRIFSLTTELGAPSPSVNRLFKYFTLERGLIAGALSALAGVGVILWLIYQWGSAGFSELHVEDTLRPMIVGATLIALGMQTFLMSFIYSMMGIPRRRG